MTKTFKNPAEAARVLRRLGFSSTADYRRLNHEHFDTWVSGQTSLGTLINTLSDPSIPRGQEAIADGKRKAEEVARRLIEAGYCVASPVKTQVGCVIRYSGSIVVL